MQELLLMNPSHAHRKGSGDFQIVFPKKIKKLRANPHGGHKSADKKLPLIGATGKQVAGAIGGAAATVAAPKLLKYDGWKDVAASGVVAVAGGGLVRGIDKDAGEAFLYTGLGITGLKAVSAMIKAARGKKAGRTPARRPPRPPIRLRQVGDVGNMSDDELDRLLGDFDETLDLDVDFFDALDAGIDDLGQEVVLS